MAISGGPCPPDATLARIYGTHSVSRARRLLTYFEERNLIVVRTDFHGRRVVAFPDLGIEFSETQGQIIDFARARSSARHFQSGNVGLLGGAIGKLTRDVRIGTGRHDGREKGLRQKAPRLLDRGAKISGRIAGGQ